jgi:hypothetical protein
MPSHKLSSPDDGSVRSFKGWLGIEDGEKC